MVRVVRGADGQVAVDPTGKRPGRGTYVCPRGECWSRALRTGSLGRSLKTEIAPADRAVLEQYAAQLLPNVESAANNSESHPEKLETGAWRPDVGAREEGTAYA
jgi:hypothetical protein